MFGSDLRLDQIPVSSGLWGIKPVPGLTRGTTSELVSDDFTDLRPVCHQNQCKARLFALVTSPICEIVVTVMICAYVVVLMVEQDDQSPETEVVIFWSHFILFILFHIEFILKIVALRHHYFSFCLNIMDFVILLLLTLGESSAGDAVFSSVSSTCLTFAGSLFY